MSDQNADRIAWVILAFAFLVLAGNIVRLVLG